MENKIWKVAGVNFDHMHMGDLLRLVAAHPNAEIVGVWHHEKTTLAEVSSRLSIPPEKQYADLDLCLTQTQPDLVILCPKTGQHAEFVEKVAPYGVHLLVEKPFASSLADADRMISAVAKTGKVLAINWPLAWYPPHRTTKRLISEGVIGDLLEVHYYDGNRGPLRHIADKIEIGEAEAARQKSLSWWYQKAEGGGSLQDYLGYGVTLGTWFLDGRKPLEVTCVVDENRGLEVDEHSVTICRYETGLSKFETRWGTFTDPWTHQPQPKCGFVVVCTKGTISSYDYEETIRVQSGENPEGEIISVDILEPPYQNPIQYLIHCLDQGIIPEGPLSPTLCRIGQQIIDSAVLSANEKRTVTLLD